MSQHHTPEPLCPATLPFSITDQEMKDLMRFHECAMDDEGYDVPKERMKRLAEIGLIRRVTSNFYEHTTFGLSIINGDFKQKSDVERQRDELLAALERVLSMDVKGHELRDRLQFSRSGREILHECNSALTSVKAVTEPTKPKSCGTCKPCAHENSITQHTGDGTA